MIKKVNIQKIKPNDENPRFITDAKFKKLIKSIKEFPEMLETRPLVVDENFVVLGGNMRLKALKSAGVFEVPIHQVKGWTDEQKKEFIIKDNLGYGEWDWDIVANEWDVQKLKDWGMDIPVFDFESDQIDADENYTRKIEAPIYEPKGEKPKVKELVNIDKVNDLIKKIENSKIKKTDKEFLKLAAYRHYVFDYSKIANYYAHSDKDVQELMEDSALIIIDFNKAIENGFIELSEEVANSFINE
jgi:hypothetical protein